MSLLTLNFRDMLDQVDINSDLYLINVYSGLFIGHLSSIVRESDPIALWNKWECGYSQNLLSVSLEYPPQTVSHCSIKELRSVDKIIKSVMKDLKVDPSEVIMPFFGGLVNDSFKSWFMILHEQDIRDVSMAAWKVREYYINLLKPHENTLKEECPGNVEKIKLKLEREDTLGGSRLYHILQLVPFESWECKATVYDDYPLTLKIAKLLREERKK